MDTKMRFKWMISEISRNQVYHNHKENMAWVATVFYITGIVSIGLLARGISECLWRSIITLLIAIAAYLVYRFIHMQFKNRWIAAGRVEGLLRAITDWPAKQEPKDKDWVREDEAFYPKYIEDKIPPKQRFNESRSDTELVSYVAIALATLASLFLLWFGKTA